MEREREEMGRQLGKDRDGEIGRYGERDRQKEMEGIVKQKRESLRDEGCGETRKGRETGKDGEIGREAERQTHGDIRRDS